MIRHTLSTPFVKQCTRGAASISSSTTTASKGIIITASSTATLNDAQITRTTESRAFFSTTNNNRTFSSLPHHLARKNNGMVNVLVKSTKVPRPITMVPLPSKKQQQHKVNNKNPYLKDQKKIVPVLEETMEEDENSHLSYVSSQKLPITSELKIVLPEEDVPRGIWPVFRMMVRCYS